MSFKHILFTALNGLSTQVTRSALTILGIVIGVASIILIMSLGQGAQKLILDQIDGLGAETVVLRPGKDSTDITSALLTRSITRQDIAALERKQNVPNLSQLAPVVVMTDPVSYRGSTYRSMLIGSSAEFMAEMLDLELESGAFFSEEDIKQQARVIIIGQTLKRDIFGNGRALGESLEIKDRKFTVVGVLSDKGIVGPFNVNETIILPYTSAQTYVTGNDYFSEIILRADKPENAAKMAYDVTLTIRDQHGIRFGEDDDFHVQTQEDIIEQIETVINVFTAFLVAVVAISLVVGGIGIMNIMLVSVSERTKEIGLRKALGARQRDILSQFLAEAVVLTGIGGIIGILIGTLLSIGVALALAKTVAEDWSFVFPIFGAILGVGVSVAVGLIFGIYPAHQASKKSPLEALRYE